MGDLAGAAGEVDVGGEIDAVAHADAAVDLNLDGAGGGHARGPRGPRGGGVAMIGGGSWD